MFLALGIFTWIKASHIAKKADSYPELKQLADLVRMIQVSLIGYAVSGAFLGLAYFDLYYALIAIIIMSGYVLQKHVIGNQINQSTQIPTVSAVSKRGKIRSFVRKPN
jgi:low temperature requirement protein LtrA